MNYIASNWYWVDSQGAIYGSARGGLVSNPRTDADYQAFVSAGGIATPDPSDNFAAGNAANLDAELARIGLPITGLTTLTKGGLIAYANAKQWALATGGFTVTINETAFLFATDSLSQGLITGKAARFEQPNPPASVNWQFAGGFATIQPSDFISAATRIADFVQATFDALDPVQAAIVAGTITTAAAIDAATWPSNVSTTPA